MFASPTHAPRSPRHAQTANRKSAIPSLPLIEPVESRTFLSVVLPGAVVPTPGTTVAARPELAGTVIYDNLIPVTAVDSGGNIAFAGVLQDRVVKETVSGTLDFYQTLRSDIPANLPTFQSVLDTVSRINFTGFVTDVDWRIDGIGTPPISPTQAARSAAGNVVTFDFFKPISTGALSYFYMVKTDATSFDLNGHTGIRFGSPASAIGVAAVVLPTAEPIGQPAHPHNPTGGIQGTVTVNPGPGQTPQPLSDTDITLKLTRGQDVTIIIVAHTDANGHFAVNGLAPGHYDVQILSPQGIVGANGGDDHGNDSASQMDVVVKPDRLSNDINFILIGL